MGVIEIFDFWFFYIQVGDTYDYNIQYKKYGTSDIRYPFTPLFFRINGYRDKKSMNGLWGRMRYRI